jgi:hypothetical protein
MKKIDLSNITTAVGMPIKSGVLSHLQSAYQEVIDAIVKGSIGGSYDPAKYYVLYGCVNSTTSPIYTVSAGAVFYNGEVYLVDAFTFTSTGGNVAIGTITTTFFSGTNADPITFTDSVARNVLQVRKVVFTSGASGSGDVNFSSLIYQSNKASNAGSKFHATAGTATFSSYQFAWTKQGDFVALNYALVLTPSTYLSGTLAFYIDMDDLPLPDKSYSLFANDIAAESIGIYNSGSEKLAYLSMQKYNDLTDLHNKIFVSITDSTTSTIIITGQIFYKAI